MGNALGAQVGRLYERLAPIFTHPAHDQLLECTRKPRKEYVPPLQKLGWSSFPESHKISSTRSRISSPPIQTFNLSNHALSYRNCGFNRAGATSSALPSSLDGMRSDGSELSQSQNRVPLTMSGIYASGSGGKTAFPRSFSNTSHGLRTWRGCPCWGTGGLSHQNLHFGGYHSL